MPNYTGFGFRQKPISDPRHWYSCGLQALHHSLLVLGIPSELRTHFRNHDGHNFFGHELDEIAAVAREFGAKADTIEAGGLGGLRQFIDKSLRKGFPIVLGCGKYPKGHEEYDHTDYHWLVIAGHAEHPDEYIWIDSAHEDLIGSWPWDGPGSITEWIVPGEAPYEALAVLPGKAHPKARSMVPYINNLAEVLSKDQDFANEWGNYLELVERVFDYAPDRSPMISAEEFFEANAYPIMQPVEWEGDDLDASEIEVLYRRLQTVANFHSFEIPSSYESHAIAHLALVMKTLLEEA